MQPSSTRLAPGTRLPAVAAVLFFPLLCAPVQAAGPGVPEKAAALDPVFVTATRSAQPIAALLADVTVIDAEEIARIGAGGLVQLLQRQAGAEIVQNGATGLIVPPHDAAGLAVAVEQLLEMPTERRHAWGLAGRAHIEQSYDIERVLDRWEAVYEEIWRRKFGAHTWVGNRG